MGSEIDEIPDYYGLLGLTPESPPEEVRRVLIERIRRTQAEISSPDAAAARRAAEENRLLLAARGVLGDAGKKAQYDERWRSHALTVARRAAAAAPPPAVAGEGLVSLLLLLDTSGSMSGAKIADARAALRAVLESMAVRRMEVALVTFGSAVRYDPRPTSERHRLEEQIEAVAADGMTPMLEALTLTRDEILPNCRGARVVALATDGHPSDGSEEEILALAAVLKQEGVRIVVVGIGDDVNRSFLERLASAPEDYHGARFSGQLPEIYRKVVAGLTVGKVK